MSGGHEWCVGVTVRPVRNKAFCKQSAGQISKGWWELGQVGVYWVVDVDLDQKQQ